MNRKMLVVGLALLLVPRVVSAATWFSCAGDTVCGSGYAEYYGTFSIVPQSDSPTGKNVWRWTFPAGDSKGNGIVTLWPAVSGVGGQEMWVEWWWKYSPGFQYHGSDNKQFYFNPSNIIGMSITPDYRLHITPQGPNIAVYPSKDTGYIEPTGVWHKYKGRYVLNTNNQYNGIWQAWVDDVMVADYSNVYYANGTTSISSPSFAVIWGGMGNVINKTQYLYMADVYIGSTDPGGGTSPAVKVPSPPNSLKIQ